MDHLNIEQSLVKDGILSQEQLKTVALEQQRSSISLIKAIRRLNFVPEEALINFLAEKLHLARFNLANFVPAAEIVALLPTAYLWQEKAVPLFKQNDELAVGMLDPLDVAVLEELRFRTGLFVRPYLVREDELNLVLASHFDRRKQEGRDRPESEALVSDEVNKPTIVDAVNLLLLQAAKVNASDIHIEPQEKKMRLRLRVDGVLKEITPPEASRYSAFVSRIKIMANLDIAEKRIPQDGRLKIDVEGEDLDVRVSVIPTTQGESIVLRLLRQNKRIMTLQELGMPKDNLASYTDLISRSSGIILVTGPTGSGKTTTLYASLSMIKGIEKNIITIEDPPEYQLDFCRQIQVNPKVNLTFATGLRSILRHDPDVIMVGEIRDFETATIAIQAALTGHLVLSTLHTNDASSAVTRLIDMGIEPFLIASCLNGIVAQRLVRVLCPKCKKPAAKQVYKNSPFPAKELQVFEPHGCQECLNTGYSGRIGIFELLVLDPEAGRLAVAKASSEDINRYYASKGARFLFNDGWEKVISGITSVQELARVLGVL